MIAVSLASCESDAYSPPSRVHATYSRYQMRGDVLQLQLWDSMTAINEAALFLCPTLPRHWIGADLAMICLSR